MVNWYSTHMAAKRKPKSRGVITMDFDRTLTVPHYDEFGEYLHYGYEPNMEMIGLLKRYVAQGYEVFK